MDEERFDERLFDSDMTEMAVDEFISLGIATPKRDKIRKGFHRCVICDWYAGSNGYLNPFHPHHVYLQGYGEDTRINSKGICSVCEREIKKYHPRKKTAFRKKYDLTKDDKAKIALWRKRQQRGKCTKEERDTQIKRIHDLAKARFDEKDRSRYKIPGEYLELIYKDGGQEKGATWRSFDPEYKTGYQYHRSYNPPREDPNDPELFRQSLTESRLGTRKHRQWTTVGRRAREAWHGFMPTWSQARKLDTQRQAIIGLLRQRAGIEF